MKIADMRRFSLLFAFVLLSMQLSAQQLWKCDNGYTRFFSETVAYDIEAKNNKTTSIISADKQEIAVKMQIVDFKFENSLMQEHFNENYMESEKYPTATFKGKINGNIDWKKNGAYPVTATGPLTIHGQTREVTLSGTITIEGDKLILRCNFEVMLADYNIEIPTVMFSKIAEKIQVNAEYTYAKYTAGK